MLSWIAIVALSALTWAQPRYLYQRPNLCKYLLSTEQVKLADLIFVKLVEPENEVLHSPADGVSNHERRTATLLATRLNKKIVLLPSLSKGIDIPAVDGIIFDDDGNPLQNFSLKTFFPNRSKGADLNEKLLYTMKVARSSIMKNYTAERWREIISSYISPKTPLADRKMECDIHAKIFGLFDKDPRPVVVVIDYSLDENAIFRLHSRREGDRFSTYLTLDSYDKGVNVLHLMERMREQAIVTEYVFIGRHNMFHVTGEGYQMTEYCDELGHEHDQTRNPQNM
jgi:hypothetical protein